MGRFFLAALLWSSIAAAQDYNIAFVMSGKGIYVMNARGSVVRRLTDDGNALLTERSWSPDGRKILFFAFRKDDAAIGEKTNLPFHFPLYVTDADGSHQHRLLDVPMLPDAMWSPDGKKILFTSAYQSRPSTAIYVVDVDSGKPTRLTDIGHNESASWSPDGKQIIFSSGGEIYVMNADGTNRTQLTKLGMRARGATFSPDGQSIAFVGDGWFLMDANGAHKKRVSQLATTHVTWSADGKHLLVSAGGGAYVSNADGSGDKSLPSGYGPILDPAFSPDGRKVIFRAHDKSGDKIYTVNADGNDLRTLNDHAGERTLFAVPPR